MPKISIRGISFDNVTMEEALLLAQNALEGQAIRTVVTPNAEIAQLSLENKDICDIINRADIILPDGAGILLAAEILGTPLKEKVAGIDFGENVIALAEKERRSVFFLGGKPGIAEAAAENIKARFPDLSIAGTNDGYFEKNGEANAAVIQKINESGADVLFVCLGAPAQEKWMDINKEKLISVKLMMGLGGSLDVYAGAVKRAPNFFVKARLEWFYRLVKEPRRIVRMMKLPKYILGTVTSRFLKKN